MSSAEVVNIDVFQLGNSAVFVRARAHALILVPQQHNEVSPKDVCQLLQYYFMSAMIIR